MSHCAAALGCPNRCECGETVKRELGVVGLQPDLSRAETTEVREEA
jgi:hypothetical protein